MKKIRLFILALMLLTTPVLARSHDVPTVQGFSSNTLVKRGDWKIYRIDYVVTAATSSFTIYDSLTAGAGSNTNVKTEGAKAISGDGNTLDFTNKPIEGSTGLYLVVDNCNVIIEYE